MPRSPRSDAERGGGGRLRGLDSLNNELIERDLSPGSSAALLAVHDLTRLSRQESQCYTTRRGRGMRRLQRPRAEFSVSPTTIAGAHSRKVTPQNGENQSCKPRRRNGRRRDDAHYLEAHQGQADP